MLSMAERLELGVDSGVWAPWLSSAAVLCVLRTSLTVSAGLAAPGRREAQPPLAVAWTD